MQSMADEEDSLLLLPRRSTSFTLHITREDQGCPTYEDSRVISFTDIVYQTASHCARWRAMGDRKNRVMLDFDLNELAPSEDEEHMGADFVAASCEREAALALQARVHHGIVTRTASGACSAPVRPTPLRITRALTRALFAATSSSTVTTSEVVQRIEAHSWSSNTSKESMSSPDDKVSFGNPLVQITPKHGSAFGAVALQATLNGDTASVNSPQILQYVAGQNLPSPASGHQRMVGSTSQPGPVPLRSGTDSSDSSPVQQAHVLVLLSEESDTNLLASRELAFTNAFPFNSQRCSPAALCTRCLAFFEVPLPAELLRLISLHPGARFFDADNGEDEEDSPPVLQNLSEEEAAKRKLLSRRHGPKSKSSKYRGVTFYKRTARWEAHIWHEGAQVYMGASATKEEAARAYDKAAIILTGVQTDLNFKPEDYQGEMAHLYKLLKEQLVIYLRRDSRGYGAQASYPGVKRGKKKKYEAFYEKDIVLGIYATEEDAARAVFNEAVRRCDGALASWIMSTHHVRNIPSYAMQRLVAFNPEPAVMQSIASASKKKRNNTRKNKMPSATMKKKRSPRSATKKQRINTLALQFS